LQHTDASSPPSIRSCSDIVILVVSVIPNFRHGVRCFTWRRADCKLRQALLLSPVTTTWWVHGGLIQPWVEDRVGFFIFSCQCPHRIWPYKTENCDDLKEWWKHACYQN
jgi:hypothetical protein